MVLQVLVLRLVLALPIAVVAVGTVLQLKL